MQKPGNVALTMTVFVALLGVAPPALAYLDPSTGSMILSAIIGLFATVGLAVKTYWYKLKSLFRRSDDRKPQPEVEPGPARERDGAAGRG